MSGAFWEDLAKDLENPEFLREYVVESVRIHTIDAVINALDEARESAGLTKAGLARAINADPATVRRMLSSGIANPTLGTLAEVAAAVGLRIVVEPMDEAEKRSITDPLRSGQAGNRRALATAAETRRRPRRSGLSTAR